MRILSALSLIVIIAACGDGYYIYYPGLIYPSNYQAFDRDTMLNGDEVYFIGLRDPSGTPNGTSTNSVTSYAIVSAAPGAPLPSDLVGTSWIGHSDNLLAPQLTITFTSDSLMSIKLDCFFSSTNILVSGNSVNQSITLSGNTVYFDNVFRIRNISDTDVFTRCSLWLDTYGLIFSSATGSADVTTIGGIPLGTFTQL